VSGHGVQTRLARHVIQSHFIAAHLQKPLFIVVSAQLNAFALIEHRKNSQQENSQKECHFADSSPSDDAFRKLDGDTRPVLALERRVIIPVLLSSGSRGFGANVDATSAAIDVAKKRLSPRQLLVHPTKKVLST
jgi:hypothetical protein